MQREARIEYEAMVRRTVEELQDRLDDPPGFRTLAAQVFLSPYHFHRIFQALVGESPRALVRRLRLERAALRLRCTTKAIAEIGAEAGYAAQEAFTKAFQAGFGVAPSVFRTERRECVGIRSRSAVHVVASGFTAFHPVDRGGPPM